MGDAIETRKPRQVEGRRIVDEPTILGAHEHMARYVEIGSGAVYKGGASLRAGAGEVLGFEDKGARARQSKRCNSAHRRAEDICTRNLVRISLHALNFAGGAVGLRIERVAVVGFDTVMLTEKVAVATEHATAICGIVLDTVLRRAADEAAERLHRDLVSRGLRLRKAGKSEGSDARCHCDD